MKDQEKAIKDKDTAYISHPLELQQRSVAQNAKRALLRGGPDCQLRA